jgi:glutaminyl-tRNA synthetase
VGELLGHVRKRHPWADPKIVKVIFFNFMLTLVIIGLCLIGYQVKLNHHLNYSACHLSFFPLQQFVDAKLYDILGERTAADDEKPSKKKKDKPAKVEVGTFAVLF